MSYEELEEEFQNFCVQKILNRRLSMVCMRKLPIGWVDFNSKFVLDKKEELEENWGNLSDISERVWRSHGKE